MNPDPKPTLASEKIPKNIIIPLMQWAKNPMCFFVYLGVPGVGKTYLCHAIQNWFDKITFKRHWGERQFFSTLRTFIERGGGDYIAETQRLSDADLLTFDDLGSSGEPTDWRKEVLFEVIDYRYESSKPTVITSNLTREQILEAYGAAFSSRVFAKKNIIVEFFDGQDMRQQ